MPEKDNHKDKQYQNNRSNIGKVFDTSFMCASELDAKRAKFVIINAMRGNTNIEDVRRVSIANGHAILVTQKQVKEINKPDNGKSKED